MADLLADGKTSSQIRKTTSLSPQIKNSLKKKEEENSWKFLDSKKIRCVPLNGVLDPALMEDIFTTTDSKLVKIISLKYNIVGEQTEQTANSRYITLILFYNNSIIKKKRY